MRVFSIGICAVLWLGSLGASLCQSGRQEVVVRNAGVPGENSQEGRERFHRDVAEYQPQVVLLYFGMNDAVNEKKMLEAGEYVRNMAWMVSEARAAHIVPVLSTIQHVDAARVLERHPVSAYGTEGPNGKIDRFNAALKAMAREQGVAVSDFCTAFDAAGGPTKMRSTDGVHLAAQGYRELAETFLKAIPGYGMRLTTIVALGDSLTYGTPLRTPEHASDEVYPAVLQKMLRERAALQLPKTRR